MTVLECKQDGDGIRLVVVELVGKQSARLLTEAGVHAIQHKTRSRNQDRIHTSTATVAVLPIPNNMTARVADDELRIDTFRGSGAGGQHRNVTDSAVRVTHLPTGLLATVTSGRSQTENKKTAMRVLLSRLQAELGNERTAQQTTQRRNQIGSASKASAIRVYDVIRDMVRDTRTGSKIRGVDTILNGDLSSLID